MHACFILFRGVAGLFISSLYMCNTHKCQDIARQVLATAGPLELLVVFATKSLSGDPSQYLLYGMHTE